MSEDTTDKLADMRVSEGAAGAVEGEKKFVLEGHAGAR